MGATFLNETTIADNLQSKWQFWHDSSIGESSADSIFEYFKISSIDTALNPFHAYPGLKIFLKWELPAD